MIRVPPPDGPFPLGSPVPWAAAERKYETMSGMLVWDDQARERIRRRRKSDRASPKNTKKWTTSEGSVVTFRRIRFYNINGEFGSFRMQRMHLFYLAPKPNGRWEAGFGPPFPAKRITIGVAIPFPVTRTGLLFRQRPRSPGSPPERSPGRGCAPKEPFETTDSHVQNHRRYLS